MRSNHTDHSDQTTDTENEETVLPPTYMVIKVAKNVPETTTKWLIDKIKGPKKSGGAELIVMMQPSVDDGLILHISASKIKFLEIAEEMEMVKTDRNGIMREFIVAELEEFLPNDMHVDDLLTISERQTIIRHELENIRALAEDDHIPGFNSYVLYEGQSICQVCHRHNIILNMFPLHDEEALKKLGNKWYWSFYQKQPIEEIRLYFGESIALYFQFLGFYTKALLIPVFLGFLQIFVSVETVPFFCVFNVVSVTLLLEIWRRKSNELAFKWGTIGMTSLDEPRPNFRGTMGVDAVSGRIQPQAPRYLTTVKMYCVSMPIVFVCMVGAFVVMLASFWAEDYIKQSDESYQQYIMLPSIIYSILVFVLNMYYRKLATYLTEWENHRTQSQYDRHRVTKLVLFEFVNNFMSLFYIAFITRDMEMLKSQVQTMLIISQMICNLQETVLPLIMKYYSFQVMSYKSQHPKSPKQKISRSEAFDQITYNLPQIQRDDPRITQVNQECVMEEYEGTFDDYLELFIQFGYVFMFSSVYPLAALWAVINNFTEIRADAFKLCKIYQRPMSRRVKDIGAWQRCFEVLSVLSIMTNCGLLYLSPQMRKQAPDLSEVEWFLLFVFLEHLLLGVRYLLHITISDKPEWVRVALAKKNYESKQAVKFERSTRNKKLLTRRFKTIHGPHRH
ncbi:anoctamin-10 isoform X2 [Aethina tumida]|nr:anoctamin-10 isoform X2 [Aethina tumida]